MNNRSRFHPLSLLYALLIADWQHKLRVVLTGLVLLQFVRWFDEYWMLNTEWLVRAGLAVALITELFPRIHPIIRRLAALILIVLLHFYKLHLWLHDVVSAQGFGHFFSLFGQPLIDGLKETMPYIQFSIGAWFIYVLSIYWLKKRSRIIMYILISVIVFAFVDSYSKFVMWDQVAYIIFSGLGLIIVEHYEHFRRKHPASWSYLAEYPEKVATPIILIVTIVMLVGIIAPNARPLLTDPYTIYKHWKGERVVTGGKGFSVPVTGSIFTRDSSSGYGRDDSALGGGFDYDYSEVMRITTTNRSYWRGETKSLYTGQGWLSSYDDHLAEAIPAEPNAPLASYDWGAELSDQLVEVKQSVQMKVDPGSYEMPEYPVLFGAYPIHSFKLGEVEIADVNSPYSDEWNVANATWSPQQGELRWNERMPYPLSYELTSEIPVTNESAWRSVKSDSYTSSEWDNYLQLPDTLPSRVENLALEVSADAETPYDKVKSIETYLRLNHLYKNKPDLSKGRSADFVDRFLFEMKEGYCDYFSSAMAVMVRAIGIPTRWVKGFKSGTTEMEEQFRRTGGFMPDFLEEDNLDGPGTYIVRNSDAHSWVEVYFPGYGWLPFEPTSGMTMPIIKGTDSGAIAESDTAFDPITDNGEEDSLLSLSWLSPTIASITLAALILLVGLLIGVRKYGWSLFLLTWRRRREAAPLDQQALLEIGRILKLFKRKGYERGSHETARESFSRWTERNHYLKRDLDLLLSILEKARYSPYGVTSDDLASVFKTRQRLKEEL